MNYLFAPESVLERNIIFQQIFVAIGPDCRLEMFPDFAGFSARLRQFNNPEIIVMLAIAKADIQNFITISDHITDASILILLSNYDTDTVNLALRLRPKFVGTMANDLEKIVPIVAKLIELKAQRENSSSSEA